MQHKEAPTRMNLSQGTEKWLSWRRNKICASDSAAILGISPWSDKRQLWLEKNNLYSRPDNPAMKRGRETEDIARQTFEDVLGLVFFPVCLEKDFLGASLDGLTIDGKVGVEIKCPGVKDHDIALSGHIPEKYMPQLQHQMFVAGLSEIYYFSYRSPLDHKYIKVEYDKAFIDNLTEEAKAFYDSLGLKECPYKEDVKYAKISDLKILEIEARLHFLYEKFSPMKREIQVLEKELISIVKSSMSGKYLNILHYSRKGSIDNTKIAKDYGIDLEKYRKSPSNCVRITPK